MADVAVLFPSVVLTVIVAEPIARPVTRPVAVTVAMAVLLDDQVTFLLVAFEGATVAVNVVLAPAATLAEVGLTETSVTPITATGPPVVKLNLSATTVAKLSFG